MSKGTQYTDFIRNTAYRHSTQASYTAGRVRPQKKSTVAAQIAAYHIILCWRQMSLTSYSGQQRMSLTSYPGQVSLLYPILSF